MNDNEKLAWVKKHCRFAQAQAMDGGIATSIAQEMLRLKNSTPAGQAAPLSPWDIQQGITQFMAKNKLTMPPGMDMQKLTGAVQNAVKGLGGPVGGKPQAPTDGRPIDMQNWINQKNAPAPAAPAAPMAPAPRAMPRKPFEAPPMPRKPFE